MGWSHPDISLEDLIGWIKGFVDILILSFGYQSSGLPAIWDADNIKKSVKWGLFLEDVLKSLRRSGNYEDSVKELDAALSNLTSDPIFPLGLAHLSSAALSNARRLILEHLLQTNPIKAEHVDALLRVVVEMDIDELSELHDDSSKAYTDRLTLGVESLNIAPAGSGLTKEDETLSVANYPTAADCLKHRDENLHAPPKSGGECMECVNANHSSFVTQLILDRQAQMSCMYSIEKGLRDLAKIIAGSNLIGTENIELERQSADGASPSGDQMLFDLYQFNHWRSRCLSYLLDKRTIKLLSGAELILKAPKEQWVRVFGGLSNSTDACYDDLLEITEILLLGLISSKWDDLIQQLMSQPCDYLSFSKKFFDLHELLEGKSPVLQSNKQENDILEYLTPLLSCQPQKLWKLPSILVAAAIPSWSILFRIHLCEVENQYNKTSSSTRWHGCKKQGNEHQDCQATERIRSLHMFHIQFSSVKS